MADTETEREGKGKTKAAKAPAGPPFTLKKWNAVAMWQWDVECDTCAICRVQVMGGEVSKAALFLGSPASFCPEKRRACLA